MQAHIKQINIKGHYTKTYQDHAGKKSNELSKMIPRRKNKIVTVLVNGGENNMSMIYHRKPDRNF